MTCLVLFSVFFILPIALSAAERDKTDSRRVPKAVVPVWPHKFMPRLLKLKDYPAVPQKVVSVGTGGDSSFAVTNYGKIYVWGHGQDYDCPGGSQQAGQGLKYDTYLPDLLKNNWPDDFKGKVITVDADSCHAYAIVKVKTGFNDVWELSKTTAHKLKDADGEPIKFISSISIAHARKLTAISSFAVNKGGLVWAWGRNDYGQLGIGTTDYTPEPVAINDYIIKNDINTFDGLSMVKAIATGGPHTAAVKFDGTVWTWGKNDKGQLGYESTEKCKAYSDLEEQKCQTYPKQVPELDNVKKVAAGCWHTVALDGSGNVWTWGSNDHGQLGDGTYDDKSYPVKVEGISMIDSIAAGCRHTTALNIVGQVFTWGSEKYDQSGNALDSSKIPVQVKDDNGEFIDIDKIDAGHYHNIALKSDGTVWTWGSNHHGQLGKPYAKTGLIPNKVEIPQY